MPTTRRQAALAAGIKSSNNQSVAKKKAASTTKKAGMATKGTSEKASPTAGGKSELKNEPKVGTKRNTKKTKDQPSKKAKLNADASEEQTDRKGYQSGTIERGHIYFLYRPRVQVEEAHSIDDIRNFHFILVPRPPDFATGQGSSSQQYGAGKDDPSDGNENKRKVLAPGADAVPAPENAHPTKKRYRVITVGKKKLPVPDPNEDESKLMKEMFWASVTSVGNDLSSLEKGLSERSYETKTRGTRHEAPARIVARGGYAIVNSEGTTPSKRETHLGYHVSHPVVADMGDVQKSLGIFSASSFILQVKNPLAPATGPQQAHSKPAEYPDWIMHDVFGAGKGNQKQSRGRAHYGLKFVSCETPELLDYEGAELLLIAARDGEQGLETSLGDGRGTALSEMEEREARNSVEKVFEELGLNLEDFPVESLGGSWI